MRHIDCDCGFVVWGESDDELVENTQHHARTAHDMEITREQVLALPIIEEATT
jgi:predicted small metal-binding protein